jgi:peptidoglycan/LPS O-acetylase OafA/YrhL
MRSVATIRLFVCLLAAVLLSLPLAAQTTSPPPLGSAAADLGAVLVFNNWYLPRYEPGARAGADTTGALLSLFRKRRYAGYLYTIPFIVGVSLALPISSTDQYGKQHVASEAISPPIGSAVLAATLVGFIVHANRFNKNHLIAIDRAYAAGTPIPARYRRLLNERHFAEAAVLREAIAQQKAREQVGATR